MARDDEKRRFSVVIAKFGTKSGQYSGCIGGEGDMDGPNHMRLDFTWHSRPQFLRSPAHSPSVLLTS